MFFKKIQLYIQALGTIQSKKKMTQILEEKIGITFPLVVFPYNKIPHNKYDIYCIQNKKNIEGIIVKRGGRFGNEILQIMHALYCAKKAGIQLIYLEWHPQFIQKKRYMLDSILFSFDKRDIQGKCCIAGKFIDIHKKGHEKIPLSEYLRLNDIIYNNLLHPRFKKQISGFQENSLVIHIRSGDIFSMKKVNKWYAQPPLAFYISVLKIANPSNVVLVYEDISNPCVEELQKYLSGKGIPYTNFCKNLENTVALLLQAKNICWGFGTFVPQIIGLKREIKKTGYIYNILDMQLCNKFEKVYFLKEKNKIYKKTVLKEWKNTKEQREKMIEYRDGDFEISVMEK